MEEQVQESTRLSDIPVFAGSELLAFGVSQMPPNIAIYTYVNGVNISPFTGPGNVGAVLGDAVITDQQGNASGWLYIPSTEGQYKFLTGEIRLTFGDSPNGIENCKYISESILMNHGLDLVDTEQGGTISLRRTEKFRTNPEGSSGDVNTTQARLDPLAQTFVVDQTRYPLGLFMTGVNLYIYTKDDALPLAVELRPMSNGKPSTTEYFNGSFVLKQPASINAADPTAGTTLATAFIFDHPIYLTPGEYAFCVTTKSDKYQLLSAKAGDGKTVKQPFAGTLFKPQNTGEWVGDNTEDLTFVLRKAKFETGSSTFTVQTKALNNLEFNRLRLLSTEVNFGDTAGVTYKVQTTQAGTGLASEFKEVAAGDLAKVIGRQRAREIGDIKVQITMTTKNADVSPMLDKQLLKGQIFNTRILPYSADVSDTELKPNHGTARSRYISKVVSLDQDFDSTGLEVKVDVNRKIGTDIEVFARVLSRNDSGFSTGIKGRPWTRIPLVAPAIKSFAGVNERLFTTETYRVLEPGLTYQNTANVATNASVTGTFKDFSQYQVKIVFYANDPSILPKIKNLVATSLL